LGLGAVPHVRPRERPDDHHRGEDEADAAGDEARPARARVAEVDRHLGGVRPGNQVRHAEEVEEALVAHPLPSLDDFFAHERNVGGRSPEADDAEPEEERHDLRGGAWRASRAQGYTGPSIGDISEA